MISQELKRIKDAKDALKVSINNKGVEVTDADSISVYASKVDLIVTGSTIEMRSINITENGKYENTSKPYSSVTVSVDDGSERIAELEGQIVNLNNQIKEKNDKINELQTKLDFDEDLLDDLRNEIATLEQEKSVLENELNELRAKINSMTDLTVTENGTYTPEFGYKKVTVNVPSDKKPEKSVTITNNGNYTYTDTVVTGLTVNVDTEKHIVTSKTISENGTYNSSGNEVWNKVIVNVPQTGVDVTLTSITVSDVGEYTAPEKIAYNKVLVPSEVFYKKYIDGEGNTYIINEDGEVIITYSGETPPTPPTPTIDEIWYKTTDGLTAQTSSYGDPLGKMGLISNTYEEEKGIMKFNKEVTIIADSAFWLCPTITSIGLPDSVTSIGEMVFYGCNGITSVGGKGSGADLELPSSLKMLGQMSFQKCKGLTNVTIPNYVENIYTSIFQDCTNLKYVNIETTLNSLPNALFNQCESLLRFNSNVDGVFIIPDSVTSIGSYVFQGCSSFTSITIPNSITTIGDSAFNGCTSLTSVNYSGTKTQFTAITKGNRWKYYIPTSCIVHCTDGDYPISDF